MSSIVVAGDTSGSITLSAPAVSGSSVLTLPVATDTLVGKATTDTLTNKTLTSPTLTAPALGTPASGILTSCTGLNYDGFKNRIINGAMVIDQRNAGASVANPAYSLDRWFADSAIAGKYTVQQNSGAVTPPAGFVNYLGAVSSSAYALLTGSYYTLQQYIEGYNVSDFAWGTANAQSVTLSFWVRSSLTGTFGGSVKNSAATRSYPFTYTVNAANTFEQKTVTIAGDTSGTWLTTNGTGISLFFGLGVGATYSGTAGAWASVNYASATGATSVVSTNGATFYITGVQLEKGSTATSFDYRPYGTELALCQRYYERINNVFATCSNAGFANSYVSYLKYAVTKRTDAALTIYSGASLTGTAGSATWYPPGTVAAVNAEGNTTDTYMFSRTGTSTYNLCTFSASISAEL